MQMSNFVLVRQRTCVQCLILLILIRPGLTASLQGAAYLLASWKHNPNERKRNTSHRRKKLTDTC
jgi:hypothetical protein